MFPCFLFFIFFFLMWHNFSRECVQSCDGCITFWKFNRKTSHLFINFKIFFFVFSSRGLYWTAAWQKKGQRKRGKPAAQDSSPGILTGTGCICIWAINIQLLFLFCLFILKEKIEFLILVVLLTFLLFFSQIFCPSAQVTSHRWEAAAVKLY